MLLPHESALRERAEGPDQPPEQDRRPGARNPPHAGGGRLLYCIDIINQVAAANAALNSFTKVMLANHIHTCVTEDVQAGNSEKVDELVKTLQKLMK